MKTFRFQMGSKIKIALNPQFTSGFASQIDPVGSVVV
jgi:hypothetical protein